MKLILVVNVNFVILKRFKIMDIKINLFLDKYMFYKNVLSVNMWWNYLLFIIRFMFNSFSFVFLIGLMEFKILKWIYLKFIVLFLMYVFGFRIFKNLRRKKLVFFSGDN